MTIEPPDSRAGAGRTSPRTSTALAAGVTTRVSRPPQPYTAQRPLNSKQSPWWTDAQRPHATKAPASGPSPQIKHVTRAVTGTSVAGYSTALSSVTGFGCRA